MRNRQPELMDDPALDASVHRAALRSLDAINGALGVYRRMDCAVRRLSGPAGTLLDVGTGGGGFLRFVARRSPRDGAARLIGLDRSSEALHAANDWSDSSLCWICSDARRMPLADASVDVVVCSLFLHHFDEPEIVAMLHEFARVAKRGVVISDLTRSRHSLALTWLFTHIASRSPIVHVDAQRSVRAALTPAELEQCAGRAGLHGAIVRRHFPFRMMLSWTR